MLSAMRKGAGSWIAKIFIGLLVLSFGVWGIADIFGRIGARPLATVGKREITDREFQQEFQTALQRLSVRVGRRLTSEQARLLGLHRRVLARLIGFAAMDSHAADLGLGITDAAIAESIAREPAFRGTDGRFDRRLFQETLRANGLSEKGYVYRQRGAQIRAQIRVALMGEVASPAPLLEAINQYRSENRILSYFRLPLAKAEKIASPDEADLRTYYEGHKRDFRAPEYRKLSLLILSPETVRTRIKVGESDLKAAYEAKAESYNKPERRELQQIFFQDMAAAKLAWKDLEAGKDFLVVAKAAGLKKKDVELGLVTKADLADAKAAEAAFALKKTGDFSKPVKGNLATVIVRAIKIKPGVKHSFEEVKEKVRVALVADRTETMLLKIYDKVEDERGGGATPEEIAKTFSLDHVVISATDLRGNTPEGKPAKGLPKRAGGLLRTAFEGDVDVELDPIDLTGGGFAWVDILAVTPERTKALDEVKDGVRKQFMAQARRRALSKTARVLVARVGKGEAVKAVAGSIGAAVKTSAPLKRSEHTEDLPNAAVKLAFSLAEFGVGSAALADGKTRVVFQVSKIKPAPPLTADAAKTLAGKLAQNIGSDLLAEYVSALQQAYGLDINQAEFSRLTGRTGL